MSFSPVQVHFLLSCAGDACCVHLHFSSFHRSVAVICLLNFLLVALHFEMGLVSATYFHLVLQCLVPEQMLLLFSCFAVRINPFQLVRPMC